jgi:hypothetical protein
MFLAKGAFNAAKGAAKGAINAGISAGKAVAHQAVNAGKAAVTGAAAAAAAAGTPTAMSDPAGSGGDAPVMASGAAAAPAEDIVKEIYPGLKKCLCESLAKMFTDASPRLMDIVIDSVQDTIKDPGLQNHIQTRVKSIASDILKDPQTKELLVNTLSENCAPIPADAAAVPAIPMAANAVRLEKGANPGQPMAFPEATPVVGGGRTRKFLVKIPRKTRRRIKRKQFMFNPALR